MFNFSGSQNIKQMSADEYFKKYGQSPFTTEPTQESKNTRSFAIGLGTGLLKSAGSTVLGLGQLGQSVVTPLSRGIDRAFGTEGFGLSPEFTREGAREIRETVLQTDQPGESLGKFVGDVTTFAIPAAGVMKVTRGAGLLKTVLGQVGSDVVVDTVMRGADFNRQTIDTAILAAIIPTGQAGLKGIKRKIGPQMGSRIVNSLIKPLQKDFSFGKNPGKAIAELGITANSLDDLASKISLNLNDVGKQISKNIAKSTKRVDITDIFKPIDDALIEASKAPRTNSALINRLNDIKADLLGVGADGVPTRNLQNLSANEIFELKKGVGVLTKWTGNASDDQLVNKALKRSYGNLKQTMEEIVPEIQKTNETYANLMSALNATVYRDKIAARSNLISLPSVNVGVGGALLTSLATGGSITPALIVGAGAAGVKKALSTPASKTRLAAWLAQASPEVKRSLFKEAPWFRSIAQTLLLEE